jgi:hypothetical protein
VSGLEWSVRIGVAYYRDVCDWRGLMGLANWVYRRGEIATPLRQANYAVVVGAA